MITAAQLAGAVDATLLSDAGDAGRDGGPGAGVELTGATIRAQDAGPGVLFAALPGAKVHGASFAAEAVEAGASAVLTDPAGVELMAQIADRLPVLVHPSPRSILGAAPGRGRDGRPRRRVGADRAPRG